MTVPDKQVVGCQDLALHQPATLKTSAYLQSWPSRLPRSQTHNRNELAAMHMDLARLEK
jgi:hypothetical protein